MKKLFILLALIPSIAYGKDIIRIDAFSVPTKNTDGTDLPSSSIVGYGVYYGLSGQAMTRIELPANVALPIVIGVPAAGTYTVTMVTKISGAESAQTSPGTGVSIHSIEVQSTDTYRIVENLGPQSKGDLVTAKVGTIPMGTLCDSTQTLSTHSATYYRIDRTTTGLTWLGNNKPATVWSLCQ